MSTTVVDAPILRRFRTALTELYGDRLDRVVLYGSRAHGDHHADSDYDIAVFLTGITNRWRELDRLADLSSRFLGETGEFIHAVAHRAEAYEEHVEQALEIAARLIEVVAGLPG
jgi:predicted nucleotidyltransferase